MTATQLAFDVASGQLYIVGNHQYLYTSDIDPTPHLTDNSYGQFQAFIIAARQPGTTNNTSRPQASSSSSSSSSSSGSSNGGGGGGGGGSVMYGMSSSSSGVGAAGSDSTSASLPVPAIVGVSLGVAAGVAVIVVVIAALLKSSKAGTAIMTWYGVKAAAIGGNGVSTTVASSTGTTTPATQTPGELETRLEMIHLHSPISAPSSSVAYTPQIHLSHIEHDLGLATAVCTSPTSPVSPTSSTSPARIGSVASSPGVTTDLIFTPFSGGVPSLFHLLARVAAKTNPEIAPSIGAIASCVAFIRVDNRVGTGFVLCGNLLVTCLHVIRGRSDRGNGEEQARRAEVKLYPVRQSGKPLPCAVYRLNPDGFFISSAFEDVRRSQHNEPALDFVIVELDRPVSDIERVPSAHRCLEQLLPPSDWQTVTAAGGGGGVGTEVRVVGCDSVQHVPFFYDPQPITRLGDGRLGNSRFPIEYRADTEACYSGGVVVDLNWRLLGMHQGFAQGGTNNRGIPIQTILGGAAVISSSGTNDSAREEFARLLRVQNI